MTALLDVDNLTVEFRTERSRLRAVDGVSFRIEPGETLAIVGESGSGKSVTALSIMRLLGEAGRIVHGRIAFEGEDLTRLPPKAMRRLRGNRMGMIFQEPMSSLNPVFTIGSQVAEPLMLHRGLSRNEAMKQAGDLLARVSIPDAHDRLRDYPHQFSGGMRQRVMIAMAIACQPALIIADEPTTALDVTVQAQIMQLLKLLMRETGSAMMLISHDLGVVAQAADRVAVMYAGRIVESAAARDLFSAPGHPYTRGLVAASMLTGGGAKTLLETIDGQPPDLARLPAGCAFASRCGVVLDRCRTATPPFLTEAGRSLACHASTPTPSRAGAGHA